MKGLITGPAITKARRGRRGSTVYRSVLHIDVDDLLVNGWELVRRNKKTSRIRAAKTIDLSLEDEVWCLLADMNFSHMSNGRHFKIELTSERADVPPKQIDALAVDEETALVVECKAAESFGRRSLQRDLNETRALQQPIRATIHQEFERRPRVCFVYVTRNIKWSSADLERAKEHGIKVLPYRKLAYFRRLVDIIGPAARHQLQAELFEGSAIRGLNETVPALRGHFGNKRFFQFVIEPDRLLKIAFVGHRAKIDAQTIGTYQRLLKRKRLKDIAKHINLQGGIFPTNIVVNFRGRRDLRFDAATPSGDDPTVFGTLYLPNTYKSAWVIDGQHRLYGFALSDQFGSGKIPVLAFDNLSESDEVGLFVDINTKQVRVPASLMAELRPDLGVDHDDDHTRLNRLVAAVANDLAENDDSTLAGNVKTEWDTDRKTRPITLQQLVGGISGSSLIGTIRSGAFYPGPLFERDWDRARVKSRQTIDKYLSLFEANAEQHWNATQNAGGFLRSNVGIAALLRAFKHMIDYQVQIEPTLDYSNIGPDGIVETIRRFTLPIALYFENADANTLKSFRGRYGSGAPLQYCLAMLEIVQGKYAEFDAPGLQEYIHEHSYETVNRAAQLLRDIEDTVRKLTIEILKSQHGEELEDWWRGGVPMAIRGSAAQKSETSEEGGHANRFLDLLDYKKIAAQPGAWLNFANYWTFDSRLRSKNDRLNWMDRLARIRNRVFHSGRRHVSAGEVEFLENTWIQVEDAWSQYCLDHPRPI